MRTFSHKRQASAYKPSPPRIRSRKHATGMFIGEAGFTDSEIIYKDQIIYLLRLMMSCTEKQSSEFP